MKRFLGLLAAVFMTVSLSACGSRKTLPSRTGFAMDTVVTITVYDQGTSTVEKALDAAFAEITRLESLLSVTLPNSDISRINASNGQAVTVSAETAAVLTEALHYAALSDGALDITVRPASELWDFTTGVIPDAAELQQAVATVDYRHLTVDGTAVTLTEGAVELGGIAKGYIGDRVAQVLENEGVTAAVIDLGGNIVALGDKNGDPFQIGIKNPQNTDALCAVVQEDHCAVVTSGIYERGFDKDGVRYHHILSPKTGMPVQNELASVTIVSQSSVQADALSTACFVLGEEKGRALVAQLDGVEALWIRRDGTIAATDGLLYTLL